MRICGFIVVRLPSWNFDVASHVKTLPLPERAGKVYEGLDRLRWFDLHGAHFDKTLPSDLEVLRSQIFDSRNDFTGIEVTQDFAEAQRVLMFVNSKAIRNEIIACYSSKLAERKGTYEYNNTLVPLGFDVFAFGEWSLISEGVFRSGILKDWAERLNQFGLIPQENECEEFFDDYMAKVDRGRVEELSLGKEYQVDNVEVMRLLKTIY